jgi:hypothetical protein
MTAVEVEWSRRTDNDADARARALAAILFTVDSGSDSSEVAQGE